MLKKQLQKGFTIVELLIVIVVIGILAALVLNTFNGVQAKARDTERKTDMKAVQSQLEAYYADKGGYPQYAQIDDVTKIKALLKGLEVGAAQAPQGPAFSFTNAASTGKTVYGYVPTGCTGVVIDTCQQYTLSWFSESGTPALVTVDSLN